MSTLITNLKLRNYKSIKQCDIKLGDLALLVGPNGSGKSNVLDALSLVQQSLDSGVDYALRERGGISEVRRKSGGHPNNFGISIRANLPGGDKASFAFSISVKSDGSFTIQREQASIVSPDGREAFYDVQNGIVESSNKDFVLPEALPDNLYLRSISGIRPFRDLFNNLSAMKFYNINPATIRAPKPNTSGDFLQKDGDNLPSVIQHMKQSQPNSKKRIEEYLHQIVDGMEGVDYKQLGHYGTIEIRQRVESQRFPWKFLAAGMSDGTLRSLGILCALFQKRDAIGSYIPLIAIEEPESTIHPGAAAVIMEAILESSETRQIIATTHSPELLDHPKVSEEQIFSVQSVEGTTAIAPISRATKSVIREQLFTAGELLRLNQLSPEIEKTSLKQSDLFN